jgi:aminopeptidase N
MKHWWPILFSISLLFPSVAPAQKFLEGPSHAEPQKAFDIVHYRLDLAFIPEKRQVKGTVFISFVPEADTVTTILLHAKKLNIDSIFCNGTPVQGWHQTDSLLMISIGHALPADTATLQIRYSVENPERGLFFNLPDSAARTNYVEIYSQGESEFNRYWFPCWDFPNDRATSEVLATVPDSLLVISNGTLLRVKDNKNGTVTYHWRMDKPHVSYLISVAIGNYVRLCEKADSISVCYNVHPADSTSAWLTFGNTPEMIRFFSRILQFPYPYKKYDQTLVHNFQYGGMENVTASTLHYESLRDSNALLDGNSDELIAHELAHQWFGDLVTCRSWTHIWLNEGFATYFAGLWLEHKFGPARFQQYMEEARSMYISEDRYLHRRALIWNRYHKPEDLFDRHAYQKGAWVLHMLRSELGDSLFFRGLHHYLTKFAWQCVSTDQFKTVMEEVTGKDLTPFFRQWVSGAGHPELRISTSYDEARKTLALTVVQSQKKDSLCTTFHFPLQVALFSDRLFQTHELFVDADSMTFQIPCERKPDFVRIDPQNRLLKEVDYRKPRQEWLAQLQWDPDPIGRQKAAEVLADSLDSLAAETLASRFLCEPVAYVRRAILKSLARTKSTALKKVINSALHDPDSWVRMQAVTVLEQIPDLLPSPFDTLEAIFDQDSSYRVRRQVLNVAAVLDSARSTPLLRRALSRPSFRETLRLGALNAIRKAQRKDLIPDVLPLTLPQYSDFLRYMAILTVSYVEPDNPRGRQRLREMLTDPYRSIRRFCASTLARSGSAEDLPFLKKALQRENVSEIRDALKKAIQRIQERMKK